MEQETIDLAMSYVGDGVRYGGIVQSLQDHGYTSDTTKRIMHTLKLRGMITVERDGKAVWVRPSKVIGGLPNK